MRAATVFQPNYGLSQLPTSLRLRDAEWVVLFSCDGKRTVGELREIRGLDPEQVDEALETLVEMLLISEVPLTAEEHLRASALHVVPRDSEPRSLGEFLQPAGLPIGSEGAAGPPRQNGAPAPRTEAPESAASAARPFVPLPQPSAPPPRPQPTASMSLKAVIDLIMRQCKDATEGQLAVYRIFMGIDTRLLKRNGIQSLRFQEDRVIVDPELQNAITENLEKHLGLRPAEDAFAASI